MTLSGGMKRRLLIAKALSHEPQILFLDEPTAGVDVELRRDMWALVRSLQARGVTIILTTHYIDEAEEMADRVGVISKGEIILVENKVELMRKLGKKQLTLHLTGRAGTHSGRARRLPPRARRRRKRIDLHVRRPGRAAQHRRAAGGHRSGGDPLQGSADDAELARRHLRQPGAGEASERSRDTRDLQVRDGAHPAHADAEHHLAGAVDLALFRGVRRGHRLAHHAGRGDQLWRLHRSRADHAVAADAEHLERVVRHLLSRSSRERSTSSCRRPFRISRSSSAMSARPRPSRSFSA